MNIKCCINCDNLITSENKTSNRYYCDNCVINCVDCNSVFIKSESNSKCYQCKSKICFCCTLKSFDYYFSILPGFDKDEYGQKIYNSKRCISCFKCRRDVKLSKNIKKIFCI
jgi:hypothetical protein